MEAAPASVHDDLLPPPDPRAVYRTGLIGLGLCAAAAVVGLAADLAGGGGPGAVSTLRLVLVAAGTLVAGSAVSMRPGLWPVWAIAAGATLLAAVAGLPGHWDSARLLARVVTGLALVGTALAAVAPSYRRAAGAALALFHFGGILTATTMPDPAPWLSTQAFNWVYTPYLTFAYMRNAYHFYSPEPGPASLIVVLVKYETDETDPKTGKPAVAHEWTTIPDRATHMRDPLGLTYYRRLALTEMVSGTTWALNTPQTAEKAEATDLRQKAAFGLRGKEPIPLAPDYVMPVVNQYRVPQAHITRYVLPSYAKHLAVELTGPGRRVLSTKVYRLEHHIVRTPVFARGGDPFHPTTYHPYYLGEYDADGRLTDPQDPMLYWYVPVVTRPGGPAPGKRQDFDDYLSRHAGYELHLFQPYKDDEDERRQP